MVLYPYIRAILQAVAIMALVGIYTLDPATATIGDVLRLMHNEVLKATTACLAMLLITTDCVAPYVFKRFPGPQGRSGLSKTPRG